MVVALICGECVVLLGMERGIAIIIWIVLSVLAVAVCYGLFVVGRKVSIWNLLWIAVSGVMMLIGFLSTYHQKQVYEEYDYVDGDVHISGLITNIQEKTYNYSIEVKTEDGIVYIAVENVENLIPGLYINASGQIDPMETADNPGNFDELSYLRSCGVIMKVKADVKDIDIVDDDQDINISGMLYEIRCHIREMLSKICTEDELGLLSAMVIGEKADIDKETKELYSMQGIAHVLAISGLHISVIGIGIYKILRRKMWYISSATVSTLIMFGFSVMTGNSVSAVRAVAMFIMHVIADVCGRKYDMLSALSLSGLLLLMDNPYYITNSSFLLSYAAMVAVSVTGPMVVEFVASKNGVLNTILFNISLTFTSMPINACLFYRLPTYSMLLNLIVVPLMSVVLLMTILGIIAGFVVEQAGIFLIGTAVYILRLYKMLATWTEGLPFSSVVTGGLQWEAVIAYYGCLVAVLLIMKYGKSLSKVLILACIMAAIVYSPKHTEFKICFLDVGQGDCSYIHSETGVDYLIDGGSTDEQGVGEYKIENFLEYMDVDTIEYVFVSHTDTDHISGIMELMERGMIGIDNLVLPVTDRADVEQVLAGYYETTSDSVSENIVELTLLAKDNDINIMYFGAGDSLTDGNIKFYCVSPDIDETYADINEASMVLLMQYKQMNAVFTGDIGADTEQSLVEDMVRLTENKPDSITVLKVAHHGSKYSNSQAWLDTLKPDIAVISCGEDNSYGHPHEEAVERIEEVGSAVWNTAECGQVILEYKKGELDLNVYKK